MNEAHWWGVSVVAGSFLIIGAVLGFLFNWLADTRKAKREDQLQERAEIRAMSLKIAEIMRKLSGLYRFRFSHQQIAFGGNYAVKDVVTAQSVIKATDQEISDLLVALEGAEVQLRVFAPPPVYLAAGEVLHSASALELPIKVRQSLELFDDGVDHYLLVVREVLGVDKK